MATVQTDHKVISMGEWSVSRLGKNPSNFPERKAIGLFLTGTGDELEGGDFLTREEALELRDYINEHLGDSNA